MVVFISCGRRCVLSLMGSTSALLILTVSSRYGSDCYISDSHDSCYCLLNVISRRNTDIFFSVLHVMMALKKNTETFHTRTPRDT
ncbi:hypothetical protein GDO86_016792 [Hymenochirus boettgeri]|uniref:Secreted protein n=1 Tax=Hymenochirus boettgeri TaxID=247094 RepID=A0A8T2IHT5_9PIPI|nr:hypothetical protein GDO86_016792 [Hymenochirus boettgeri]